MESGGILQPVQPKIPVFLIALDVLPVCTDDAVLPDGCSTFFEQAVNIITVAAVITEMIVFFMIDNFCLVFDLTIVCLCMPIMTTQSSGRTMPIPN